MSPVAEGKLRLGGMALRNGLLIHGPTHWAASVRDDAGEIRTASGRKPRVQGVDGVPGVRGVVRLGEAFVVIPLVKRALPAARLPFESPSVLAIAAGGDLSCVREIFRFIWREGRDPSSDEGFEQLCERVGLPHGEALIEQESVRAQLRRNTNDAIALGVFGVPTFWMNKQLFWGEDALPMVLYCARSPNWLDSREVRRISSLPSGIAKAEVS